MNTHTTHACTSPPALLPFLRPLLVWLQPARATGDFAVLSDRCLALLRDRVKDSSEKKVCGAIFAIVHAIQKVSVGEKYIASNHDIATQHDSNLVVFSN